MNELNKDQSDQNQPQIIVQDKNQKKLKQKNPKASPQLNKSPQSHDINKKTTAQAMNEINKKHPDCIPIFFVKHEASPKQFPSPKIPFILFKKQFKIQQAMIHLYNQIEIKGLYFFCTRFNEQQKKMKHVMLKPGESIQQIYKRFGKDGYLTLIYGDKNIGMGGVNKMEKWLIRILIVLGIIWIFLYGYPLYFIYQRGGISAVWKTITGANRQNSSQEQNKKEEIKDIIIDSTQNQKVVEMKVQDLESQEKILNPQNQIPSQDYWSQTKIVHQNNPPVFKENQQSVKAFQEDEIQDL